MPGVTSTSLPQPTTPRTTEGGVERRASLDDAVSAARARLIQALTDAAPQGQADADAEQLITCLNSPDLDFTRLAAQHQALAYTMPASAWTALHELALAAGTPITHVQLPRPADVAQVVAVVQGLNELKALASLQMPVPARGSAVPLHGLGHAAGLHIALDTWRADAWHITVAPQTASVETEGSGLLDVAPARGVVRYLGDDGVEVGAPRKLSEGTWQRTATEGGLDGFETLQGQPLTPQQAANALNLNGVARFTDAEASSLALPTPKKVCRHIAIAWSDACQARPGDSKSGEGVARQTYERFMSASPLGAAITAQTERDFQAVVNGQAPALVAKGSFGVALRQEFEAMRPGERRNLLIATTNHMMAMELRVKTRGQGENAHPVYVVRFHDPNRTATHVRHVTSSLARLEPLDIERWLGHRLALYFEPQEPQVLALYRFERPLRVHEEPGRLVGVTAETLRHPSMQRQLLRLQHAQQVTRSVQGILASDATSTTKTQQLTARGSDHFTALSVAMANGATQTVRAWLDAVLGAPAGQLSREERFQLVQSADAPEDGHQRPALGAVLVREQPETVQIYAHAILHAPPHALTPAQRVALLMAEFPPGDPLLQRLAESDQPSDHRGLYLLLQEVVRAPGLSLADKRRLVASSVRSGLFSRTSAGETAMDNGHPAAAAAMICAVRESGAAPDTIKALRKAIGVSAQQVMNALDKRDPVEGAWWTRLNDVRRKTPR